MLSSSMPSSGLLLLPSKPHLPPWGTPAGRALRREVMGPIRALRRVRHGFGTSSISSSFSCSSVNGEGASIRDCLPGVRPDLKLTGDFLKVKVLAQFIIKQLTDRGLINLQPQGFFAAAIVEGKVKFLPPH
eukprot:7201084-Pyramimonas_sp.AAC.1